MFKLFKRKKSDPAEELKDILEGYELPSFPAAVMNVLSMLRDPESSMIAIAEMIKVDPGMNVRVLGTVNSAAFGLASKVSNIQHAVTLLGRSRLEAIILSLAVRDSIPQAKASCFDIGEFWRTSARRASLARLLAHQLHPVTETESFTAGLLQDMGIPVLVDIKKEGYCELLNRYYENRSSNIEELEREAFGFDHQTIGGLMAEKWGLPEYMVNAIGNHHGGADEGGVDPAIYLVSLLREYDQPEGNEMLFRVAENDFGIRKEEMLDAINSAFQDAEEFSELLS